MVAYQPDSPEQLERIRRRKGRDSFWAGIFAGLFIGFFATGLLLVFGYSTGVIPNEDLRAYRKLQEEMQEKERDAFFGTVVGPDWDHLSSRSDKGETEYQKDHGSTIPSREAEKRRSPEAVLYAEWIKDWLVQGGEFDPSGSFSSLPMGDSVGIIENGQVIDAGSYRSEQDLIAPKGTAFVVADLGTVTIYYWDNEGKARKEGTGRPIIYSDVLEELKEMDIPEVDKKLGI